VAQHEELKEELCDVFRTSLSTAAFIGGAAVSGFEQDFAAFSHTAHCVGVSSGTDALRFALIAAGVEQGDIVVTVPNTFIATTEAISQAGAYPVFVDVDDATYNLDPHKLREYVETECAYDEKSQRLVDRKRARRVSAIVPVHLYGQTADMDPILELADHYHLTVIEDACQAHGAEYFSRKENRWRKAGSMGKAAAFSFYPGKNLGACGEGGAVTTNDPDIAQHIGMLRDHGQTRKYYHQVEGYNGRLDAIQAGLLRVKLRYLPQWNDQRRERAATYDNLFAAEDRALIRPYVPAWSRPSYHLYVNGLPSTSS
jgi:dTDP-4-amino-4,6-dideoxygalactose transaminase